MTFALECITESNWCFRMYLSTLGMSIRLNLVCCLGFCRFLKKCLLNFVFSLQISYILENFRSNGQTSLIKNKIFLLIKIFKVVFCQKMRFSVFRYRKTLIIHKIQMVPTSWVLLTEKYFFIHLINVACRHFSFIFQYNLYIYTCTV